MTTRANKRLVDASYHRRRLAERLKSPEFRAEYEHSQAEIAQIDAIMRTLDNLRKEAGFSKADLARGIGKNPASVRRLFTAQVNPELKTIAALAYALNAEVRIVSKAGTSPTSRSTSRQRRSKPR